LWISSISSSTMSNREPPPTEVGGMKEALGITSTFVELFPGTLSEKRVTP